MRHRIDRREFMGRVGAGAAVLSLPGFVVSCSTPRAALGPAAAASAGPGSFDAFGIDAALIQRVLTRALSLGGDFSEVFLQHRITHWLALEDGQVDRAYSEIDLGAGIRVLKGDATGFAFCEDLSEAALLATASTAAAVADGTPVARPAPLRATPPAGRYPIAVPWTEVGVERKLPLVQQLDRLARGRDTRVIKVSASLEDQTSHILVANSLGLLTEDLQPMAALVCSVVAEHKGATETSFRSAAARDGLSFVSDERLRALAHEAVDECVSLFDAGSPPVGELPVVLGPGITGILLHEAMGHGMEADFNRKGISIYADRIGKRVAPEQVTIVDDGTNPRMRGSIDVDDEGAATQRTVLVENGILRSYLHDHISARHYNTATTGSGRRESFRFPPVPRMRNTYMLNGTHDPQEIIASVEKGLYAENFLNGQVFIGAGDFTFYLKSGRLIENGKLTRVVKDANLVGKGPTVLEKVAMVGNDMTLFSGAGFCGKDGQRVPVGFGLPTLRVGGMSIGGRTA